MTDASNQPLPGDVVFHRGRPAEKLDRIMSGVAQVIVDGNARGGISDFPAKKFFPHVSMVLRDSFILEAMPSTENSEWTKLTYDAGVRFKTIEDLLVSFEKEGEAFTVLRSPQASSHDARVFDLASPEVGAIMGEGYSIQPLVDAAPFQGIVQAAMADQSDWSAPNSNILTTVKIPEEFRDALRQQFGYEFPFDEQSFFCSQLVAFLLKRAGAVPLSMDANITPMGLRRMLSKLGWIDVTASAYGSETLGRLAQSKPLYIRHRYYRASLNVTAGQIDRMRQELTTISSSQSAQLDAMSDDLREQTRRLHEQMEHDDPAMEKLVLLIYLKLINAHLHLFNAVLGIKGLEMDIAHARLLTSLSKDE